MTALITSIISIARDAIDIMRQTTWRINDGLDLTEVTLGR